MGRVSYLNLVSDHSTLLLSPRMYRVYYPVLRILFGVSIEDIIYQVRSKDGSESMTFAARIGSDDLREDRNVKHTLYAVVEPSEPENQFSHVRAMLENHSATSLWQHQALRTSDLLALHRYMSTRGVNFITPILEDGKEDLLQVFTGELFGPGDPPSAVFFEFVQRKVTSELRLRLAEHNRQTFFRDKTFLGLYEIKEREYKKRDIAPFIDHELFLLVERYVGKKKQWEITERDIHTLRHLMEGYVRRKKQPKDSLNETP